MDLLGMENSFHFPSVADQPLLASQDHDDRQSENGQEEPSSSAGKHWPPSEGSRNLLRKKPKRVTFTPDALKSSQRVHDGPGSHDQGRSQDDAIFHQEPLPMPAVDFPEAMKLPIAPVESVHVIHPPQTDVAALPLSQEQQCDGYPRRKRSQHPLLML